jgi:hypothetical protein
LSERAGIERILAELVALFSIPAPKIALVEASTGMLRILHESKENRSEGIATGDGSWFQYFYSYPASKMFAPSPTDIIPRTRPAIRAKQTTRTIFVIGYKLIVLEISPKASKFNKLYCIDYIFPI